MGVEEPRTGFKDVDQIIGSFQNSTLTIISGETSIGKTSFVFDIARNTALRNNIPVALFSFEMNNSQVTDRLLAAEARSTTYHMRNGLLSSDEEFKSIGKAIEKLATSPIFIDDDPDNTIESLETTILVFKEKFQKGLIVIDSLELVHSNKSFKDSSEKNSTIIRELKRIARKSDLPIVITSQISDTYRERGGDPRLSDLHEMGSLEQAADTIIFITGRTYRWDNDDPEGIRHIFVEKNRSGPTGTTELYFDKRTSNFLPIEKGDMKSFDDVEF